MCVGLSAKVVKISNGTAADGTEGYRCHDSYRPRTA